MSDCPLGCHLNFNTVNYLLYLYPLTQHYSFFRNLPPLFFHNILTYLLLIFKFALSCCRALISRATTVLFYLNARKTLNTVEASSCVRDEYQLGEPPPLFLSILKINIFSL